MGKLDLIYEKTKDHWGFDFKEQNRKTTQILARASFYYMSLKHTPYTLEVISRYVGRDHATVINARKKRDTYESYYKGDNFMFNRHPSFKELVDKIDQDILAKINPTEIEKFIRNYNEIQRMILENEQLYSEIDNELKQQTHEKSTQEKM